MLLRRVLRVVVVCWALGATVSAARADMYYCDTVVSGSCTHYTAATDGIMTLENMGLSGTAIATAIGFGVGLIFGAWTLGYAGGLVTRAIRISFGETGE